VQPLSEFHVPPESCPTLPSPPAAASRLLSWAFVPYSTCGARRSTSTSAPADRRPPPPARWEPTREPATPSWPRWLAPSNPQRPGHRSGRRCTPATFRLQGLATLVTVYALQARVGFISRRQRSWDSPCGALLLPKGIRGFHRRMNPRAVSPVGIPAAGHAVGRPNRPRLLGFDPFQSPVRLARD